MTIDEINHFLSFRAKCEQIGLAIDDCKELYIWQTENKEPQPLTRQDILTLVGFMDQSMYSTDRQFAKHEAVYLKLCKLLE